MVQTHKGLIFTLSDTAHLFCLGLCRHRLGEDNGTPLQYSSLENSTDGGAWWAAVHGVTKSQT